MALSANMIAFPCRLSWLRMAQMLSLVLAM